MEALLIQGKCLFVYISYTLPTMAFVLRAFRLSHADVFSLLESSLAGGAFCLFPYDLVPRLIVKRQNRENHTFPGGCTTGQLSITLFVTPLKSLLSVVPLAVTSHIKCGITTHWGNSNLIMSSYVVPLLLGSSYSQTCCCCCCFVVVVVVVVVLKQTKLP